MAKITIGRVRPDARFSLASAHVGQWRWRCADPNDPWHYAVDDTGWRSTFTEALAAGLEHQRLHLALARCWAVYEQTAR